MISFDIKAVNKLFLIYIFSNYYQISEKKVNTSGSKRRLPVDSH